MTRAGWLGGAALVGVGALLAITWALVGSQGSGDPAESPAPRSAPPAEDGSARSAAPDGPARVAPRPAARSAAEGAGPPPSTETVIRATEAELEQRSTRSAEAQIARHLQRLDVKADEAEQAGNAEHARLLRERARLLRERLARMQEAE